MNGKEFIKLYSFILLLNVTALELSCYYTTVTIIKLSAILLIIVIVHYLEVLCMKI